MLFPKLSIYKNHRSEILEFRFKLLSERRAGGLEQTDYNPWKQN